MIRVAFASSLVIAASACSSSSGSASPDGGTDATTNDGSPGNGTCSITITGDISGTFDCVTGVIPNAIPGADEPTLRVLATPTQTVSVRFSATCRIRS